jgi:hypothetical protein
MGIPQQIFEKEGDRYQKKIDDIAKQLTALFGTSEVLTVCDTYMFDDYSKYASSMFDPKQKLLQREVGFKRELQTAYNMGVSFFS